MREAVAFGLGYVNLFVSVGLAVFACMTLVREARHVALLLLIPVIMFATATWLFWSMRQLFNWGVGPSVF